MEEQTKIDNKREIIKCSKIGEAVDNHERPHAKET